MHMKPSYLTCVVNYWSSSNCKTQVQMGLYLVALQPTIIEPNRPIYSFGPSLHLLVGLPCRTHASPPPRHRFNFPGPTPLHLLSTASTSLDPRLSLAVPRSPVVLTSPHPFANALALFPLPSTSPPVSPPSSSLSLGGLWRLRYPSPSFQRRCSSMLLPALRPRPVSPWTISIASSSLAL